MQLDCLSVDMVLKLLQMNLKYIVSKDACFYYWLQAVSNWDAHASCEPAYKYYQDKLGELTTKQTDALSQIAKILLASVRPRKLLAELYSSHPSSEDAHFIVTLSESFKQIFHNTVWHDSEAILEQWKSDLENYKNEALLDRIQQIKHFLKSDFDIDSTIKVYLLQNPSFMGSAGHAIKDTDFILLHPNCSNNPEKLPNTINSLVHEYIHHIENASAISRDLFKESYLKTIGKADLPGPKGYVWKMVYVETLIYAFTNNFYYGILRPDIYNKTALLPEDVKDSFDQIVSDNKYDTNNVIAWVALNVQQDVKKYLDDAKTLDSDLVDKISDLLLDIYLTNSEK